MQNGECNVRNFNTTAITRLLSSRLVDSSVLSMTIEFEYFVSAKKSKWRM